MIRITTTVAIDGAEPMEWTHTYEESTSSIREALEWLRVKDPYAFCRIGFVSPDLFRERGFGHLLVCARTDMRAGDSFVVRGGFAVLADAGAWNCYTLQHDAPEGTVAMVVSEPLYEWGAA